MDGKIRVLMVDDEERFRQTTSKILSRKGYEVNVAESGEKAVEWVKKNPVDVVVLDIKMPGISGEEALQQIKEVDADMQVIMLTGHGGEESAKTSLHRDAYDYLNKPCDIDLLSAKIREAYFVRSGEVKTEKNVSDIMIPIGDYATINADATIKDGIARLKESFEAFQTTTRIMESGHRALMVFEDEEVVGVLNMRNMMESLRPAYLSAPKPSMADSMQYSAMFWTGLFSKQVKEAEAKLVRDYMNNRPPLVDHDANLMEAANLMCEENRRRVAVMDQGRVVGVVREQEIFYEIARVMLSGKK